MKYEQAFEKIKAILKDADTAMFENDFAIQVNLKNKDCGGAFYIEYKDGAFHVEPYDYHDNNAMITIMSGDFMKLVEGSLDLEKAVAKGNVEIEGEYDKAALIKGIAKPIKKAAAPKTTKAPVKKTAPAAKTAVKAVKAVPEESVKEAAPKKKTRTTVKKTK